MAAARDEATKAGRGVISITAAKIYFILASFGVQFTLPRVFDSEILFGRYATTMSGIAILNNVLIAATIQSVSKFVSEDDDRAPEVLRQGLKIQAVLGITLFAALMLLSEPLAAFISDPVLTPLFRAASVVVLAYSLYATMVGSLNGGRRYGAQAKLDMTFTTLRTVGIVLGAALGFGALGALGGFATAAAGITLIAMTTVGTGRKGPGITVGAWIAFMAPIWLYQGALNALLQIDIWVMKKTLADLAVMAGSAVQDAGDIASRYAGIYRGAQVFAFVPYQLVLAITFVVFPMVSRATASGDEEGAKRTIAGAMRFSMLVLVAVAAPVAGSADGVIRLAFPEPYVAGAPALRILIFGLVAFTLFAIGATILNGAGLPRTSALIGGLAAGAVVLVNRWALLAVGLGDTVLVTAASATTAGMLLAAGLTGLAVHRRFGAFIPAGTFIRAVMAGCAAMATAHFLPHDEPALAVGAATAGGLVYLGTLFVLREIGEEDLAMIKRLLGKG